MDSIYCYSDTDVLINRLNIHDQSKLADIERQLTTLRIQRLLNKPVKGNFDLKHLQKIHKYIFQDLYDWAGKIRTVDIAKGNMFCKVQLIQEQAVEIFGKLQQENYLSGLERTETARRLAFYFSEINALHPFREGNGRSQREFIRELALQNGYRISFSIVSPEEMLQASMDSFLCRYEKMERLFLKSLT